MPPTSNLQVLSLATVLLSSCHFGNFSGILAVPIPRLDPPPSVGLWLIRVFGSDFWVGYHHIGALARNEEITGRVSDRNQLTPAMSHARDMVAPGRNTHWAKNGARMLDCGKAAHDANEARNWALLFFSFNLAGPVS